MLKDTMFKTVCVYVEKMSLYYKIIIIIFLFTTFSLVSVYKTIIVKWLFD